MAEEVKCRSLPRIERSIDRRPDAAIRAARERDEAARIVRRPEKRNEG